MCALWTNLDSFATTYLMSSLLQKLHFPVEVVLNSLPNNIKYTFGNLKGR